MNGSRSGEPAAESGSTYYRQRLQTAKQDGLTAILIFILGGGPPWYRERSCVVRAGLTFIETVK